MNGQASVRKGQRTEARVKAIIAARPGKLVVDLSPNFPGTDLLVLDNAPNQIGEPVWRLACAVEVKATPWRLMPSNARQACADAGAYWAALGIAYEVWCPESRAPSARWVVRTVEPTAEGKARTVSTARTAHPFRGVD